MPIYEAGGQFEPVHFCENDFTRSPLEFPDDLLIEKQVFSIVSSCIRFGFLCLKMRDLSREHVLHVMKSIPIKVFDPFLRDMRNIMLLSRKTPTPVLQEHVKSKHLRTDSIGDLLKDFIESLTNQRSRTFTEAEGIATNQIESTDILVQSSFPRKSPHT